MIDHMTAPEPAPSPTEYSPQQAAAIMNARGVVISSRTIHRDIDRGLLHARDTEEGWKKITATALDEYITLKQRQQAEGGDRD